MPPVASGTISIPFSSRVALCNRVSGDLPGHPGLQIKETESADICPSTLSFVGQDLDTEQLDSVAHKLWILTTPKASNISPLHQQLLKGRRIVLTEAARLHLTWIHDRIFIKPLPEYLLSHSFWTQLSVAHGEDDRRHKISNSAKGILRSYAHLIRHQSDFEIAIRKEHRLLPADVTWPDFRYFAQEVEVIQDSQVADRYRCGELRLSRLNLYAPFLFGCFYYEQIHWEYADYFARFFGPLAFVFAVLSTTIGALQLRLAADNASPIVTASLRSACRGVSWFILSVVATGVAVLIFLWLWMLLDETIYAVRLRWNHRRTRWSLT
ncbi:hypothetical protein BDZ85DRAFT_312380 [Elsinoe ampelina]|uniref:Subtilisin-like serine protease n=1 Tax=Elsinoe ampelina TaxID=302913 RepID=A0A6A6GAW3_9PEZI|nr:hypothetical protein BDZ85DRAFT_312380 [Elsinoe ampelina]